MTHIIEKDESVANQRTLHFRLFTSDGTTPDTTASGDSIIVARGSTTTFVPDLQIAAVHAAQGMYSAILTASNISNLGPHALYHTQGSFPQHVANFDVVNFNPYSNFSNIAVKTYSGVTVGSAATILAGTYSGVTVGINNIAAGTYSGVTVGAGSFAPGTYSAVTFSAGGTAPSLVTLAPGTHSSVTIAGVTRVNSSVTIADATYSAVTVGAGNFTPGTYSAVTFSTGNIAPGTYSGVTVGVGGIAKATYSGVTVGINDIASGTIQTADFAAAALDATVFATDAEQAFADRLILRNIAGGSDSGRTVGQAFCAIRNKVDASGSVGTVYLTDDSTSCWTFSTTTGAFPLQSMDPA